MYRGQFWISPREPLKFQTNTSPRHGKLTLVSGLVLSLLLDCSSLYLIIQVLTQESLPQRGLLPLSCHTAPHYSYLQSTYLSDIIQLIHIFIPCTLESPWGQRLCVIHGCPEQCPAQGRCSVSVCSLANGTPSQAYQQKVFLQQMGPCRLQERALWRRTLWHRTVWGFPIMLEETSNTSVLPQTPGDIKGRQWPFWCREAVPYSKETDLAHHQQ